MFEAVVAKFLMRYLKEYIKTIKGNQMEMELWKGHAVFENLELLPTALTRHEIPFTVKKGVIGFVNLHFPWKKLNTEACVVEISDVFVVLEPDTEVLVNREVQAEISAIHTSAKEITKEDERGTWQGLISTIIDNARVTVSNIHVRIHLTAEFGIMAFGLILPSFTLISVDEGGRPLTTVIKRANVVRKQVELKRMAMYFDTITPDEIDFGLGFQAQMKRLIDSDTHQFLLKPFTMECMLVHTRNNPSVLKNVLTMVTENLILSIDYSQCRGLLKFSEIWNQWMRRVRFAHCVRPKNLTNEHQWWQYCHRCAVQKNRPNEFRVDLAMSILTNKAKYLASFRQKQEAGIHPFAKSRLKKIEKAIGPTASMYLKKYAEARIEKETKVANDLTAMDLSELKGIIETTDLFFDASSFSATLTIPLFLIELCYSSDVPLARVRAFHAQTELVSRQAGAEFHFEVLGVSIDSFVNPEASKQLLIIDGGTESSFLKVHTIVPYTADPPVMDISMQPVTNVMDLETIRAALEFVREPRHDDEPEQESDQKEFTRGRVALIDVADELQRLLYFKNHILNVNCHGFSFVFPFQHDGKDQEMRFALKNLKIHKHSGHIIAKVVDEIHLTFDIGFTIDDLTISDTNLFKQFAFSFNFGFTFFPGTDRVAFDANLEFGKIALEFSQHSVDLLSAAKNYISTIDFSSQSDNTEKTTTVMSFTKVNCNFSLTMSEIELLLSDIESSLTIKDITGRYNITKGLTDAHLDIEIITLQEKDRVTLSLPNKMTHMTLTQASLKEPIIYTLVITEPKIYIDLVWAKFLMEKLSKLAKTFVGEPSDAAALPGKATETASKGDESPATFAVVLRNGIFELPDEHGNYLIKCHTLKIGDTIDLEGLSVFKQKDILIRPFTVSLKLGKDSLNGNIDVIDSDIDAPFLFAIMRIIDKVVTFLDTDEPSPGDFVTEFNVNLAKLTLKVNGRSFGRASVKSLTAKFISGPTSSTGTVTINSVTATQQIQGNNFPLLELQNGVTIDMKIDEKRKDLTYSAIGGEVYLSPDLYQFLFKMLEDDSLPPEVPPVIKDTKHVIDLSHLKAYVLDGSDKIVCLEPEKFEVVADFWDNDKESNITVTFEDITGRSSLMGEELRDVIRVPERIEIGLRLDVLKVDINEIFFACTYDLLLRMSQAVLVIMTDPADTSPTALKMGFNVHINTVNVELLPLEFKGIPCKFRVDDISFILKCAQKLATASIGAVSCSIPHANPSDALKIDGIQAIAAFEKRDGPMEFADITDLPDELKPKEVILDCISFRARVGNIRVNYTHDFARSVILCFIHKEADVAKTDPLEALELVRGDSVAGFAESRPSSGPLVMNNYRPEDSIVVPTNPDLQASEFPDLIPETPEDATSKPTEEPLPLKSAVSGYLSLDELKVVLYCVNPVGSLRLTNVDTSYADEEWNGHVEKFEVFSSENDSVSLLTTETNLPLVTLKIKGGVCTTEFCPTVFNLDYMFYLTAANYILRSPFFHVQSVHNETSDSSEITLPFDWILRTDQCSVRIPTSADLDQPILVVDLDFTMELTKKVLEMGVSNLSLHFYDPVVKVHDLPLFKGVSVNFSRRILEKDKTALKVTASAITMVISALDLVLFDKIRQELQHSAELVVFSEDVPSDEKNQSHSITELEFTWDASELIICSDNRTSTQYIPLFQLVIPTVFFKLSSTENVGSMELNISPYAQYYNETTGNWDMIVEPIKATILAMLTDSQFSVSFKVEENLNINLPARAVVQYLDLHNVIRQSLYRSGLRCSEFPRFWIQSNLPEEAHFTVKGCHNEFFILVTGQQIPIFDMESTSSVRMEYRGKAYMVTPNTIVFPTFLSHHAAVCKKPYKGGILLLFQAPEQIENQLGIAIDIYQKTNDVFTVMTTLEPGGVWPLTLHKTRPSEFLFVEHDGKTTRKHQVVSLTRSMTEPLMVPIEVGGQVVKIMVTFRNDSASAMKIVTLMSPVVGVSLLPIPLHMKIEGIQETIVLQQENIVSLLHINPTSSKFMGTFSLDSATYPKYDKVSFSLKKATHAPFYNPMVGKPGKIAVFCEQDELTKQITMSFFVPCVFFNLTKKIPIRITEYNEKNPLTIIVDPGVFGVWCPMSFFDDNDEVFVNLSVPKTTKRYSKFDCLNSRDGTVFMQSRTEENVYYGLRYDVSIKSRISVVTFSTLLIVHNELGTKIAIQPVSDVRNCETGEGEKLQSAGKQVVIEPGSEVEVNQVTPNGAFLFFIAGVAARSLVLLLSEHKTVFKLKSARKCIFVELEVVDVGTQFHAYFRKTTFPTPVVIENCLDVAVSAYQSAPANNISICPHSTSLFAFDGPSSYPSVHLDFDDQSLFVSFSEETGFIQTHAVSNDLPVFVAVQKTKTGSMAVVLTTEIPIVESTFVTSFSCSVSGLNISLIDLEMRELALISIEDVKAKLVYQSTGITFNASVMKLQVDDQNPKAPKPVIALGRSCGDNPFLSFRCIMPSDAPLFSTIRYASAQIQRIDFEVDAAFVSDIFYTVAAIVKPIKQTVSPRLPDNSRREQSSSVVSFDWLEMAPIYALLKYNRKTGRPSLVHDMQTYLKYVPSMSGKLFLPGVMSTQLCDYFSVIREKIVSEYKTAAFHQIIAMLGGKGKIMSAFGVTATIAQMLGIKLTSELTSEKVQVVEESEVFDNRKHMCGPFSEEALNRVSELIKRFEFPSSNFVAALLKNTDIGLRTKRSGNGVIGLVSKTPSEALMKGIGHMDGAARKRVPRAFPNNEIAAFSTRLSVAQNIIQKVALNEKIRMAVFPNSQSPYVCCTDRFVFVLDRELTAIVQTISIADIGLIARSSESTDLIITAKPKKGPEQDLQIQCVSGDQMYKLEIYLKSQKLMGSIFSDSLI